MAGLEGTVYRLHQENTQLRATYEVLFSWNMLVEYRSRIHELTISLRFQGVILRFIRLEVSMKNVYIVNQFQATFAQEEGRGNIR